MVVRPKVKLNPELISAVITRSRDSLTAASGSPTMTINVSPNPALTSTSTGYASMPLTAAEQTLANIALLCARERDSAMRKWGAAELGCRAQGVFGHIERAGAQRRADAGAVPGVAKSLRLYGTGGVVTRARSASYRAGS
jgi:hypothetical protein